MAATEHIIEHTASDGALIHLAHMPQQAHVWKPDDDWTGVMDPKERRRLQNRQNQRKWRMLILKPQVYSVLTWRRRETETSPATVETIKDNHGELRIGVEVGFIKFSIQRKSRNRKGASLRSCSPKCTRIPALV